LSGKQKAAKEVSGAVWLVARAVQASDLWEIYFCLQSSYFQSESAPNPLSFAPRLNLSII